MINKSRLRSKIRKYEPNKTEYIIKTLPLFTGLLIFLGYWNLYSYYINFNISIFHFISTSELILSFLPIIIKLLIIFFAFFIMRLGRIWAFTKIFDGKSVYLWKDKFTQIPETHHFTIMIKELLSTLKSIFKPKEKKNKWQVLSDLFATLILLAIIIYSIYFINNAFGVDKSKMYRDYPEIIFIILCWSYIAISWMRPTIMRAWKLLMNAYLSAIQYWAMAALLLLFIFISVTNSCIAYSVYDGFPKKDVKIELGNYFIKTNSSFVYLGMTNDYIFFRDLKKGVNIIYPLKEVKSIQLKEIKKPWGNSNSLLDSF